MITREIKRLRVQRFDLPQAKYCHICQHRVVSRGGIHPRAPRSKEQWTGTTEVRARGARR